MQPPNQGEADKAVAKLSQVIQIDERKIQEHLGEVVRSTVEATLNAMLDAEADRLCRAERYERTEARKDTRAGPYERHLQTKAGEVTLKVPKLTQPAILRPPLSNATAGGKVRWKKRWWRYILRG